MTPLRQAMIDAMQVRGFAPSTQASYLSAICSLARYAKRSPDQLSNAELQDYFMYLVKERHLAPASCHLHLNGIVFLFRNVLGRELHDVIHIPKQQQRIPELLTHQEVAAILNACRNVKHHMMLTLCYACGLRLSEVVARRVSDIDSERYLLRVEQAKGGKDRLVEIPLTLLEQLRTYWRQLRPDYWLFPGARAGEPLGKSAIDRAFRSAKARAGISKIGGIHSLRHAYATHQLAAGMPLVKLQHQLGHRDIGTTMRYLHWLPQSEGGVPQTDLLAELEVHHER